MTAGVAAWGSFSRRATPSTSTANANTWSTCGASSPPSSPSASSTFDGPLGAHPPSTPVTIPSSDPADAARCKYPDTPSTIHRDAPLSPTTPTAAAAMGASSSNDAAAPLSPSYDRSRRRTMKLIRAKRKMVKTEALGGDVSGSRANYASSGSSLLSTTTAPSGSSVTSPPRCRSTRDGQTTPQELSARSPATPRRKCTPKLMVRGNVTPSRAAPIFRLYQQRLGTGSGSSASRKVDGRRGLRREEARRVERARVEGRKRARSDLSSDDDSSDDSQRGCAADALASSDEDEQDDPAWGFKRGLGHHQLGFGRARLSFSMPRPLVLRSTIPHDDPASALLMARQGVRCGLGSSRLGASKALTGAVSELPYLSTFASTPERRHVPSLESLSLYEARHSEDESARLVASLGPSEPYAHPLCAMYSNASRSMDNYRAQWLAVGSSEGTVVLFNTLIDPMALEQPQDRPPPYWQACAGSIFELAWRADDRVIAIGGSDYTVKTWDTETFAHLGSFGGSRGSPRSLVWDPSSTTGSLILSGGRDGAIHLFDTRVDTGSSSSPGTEERAPVMSLWAAHTVLPTRPASGPGSRGGRVQRGSNRFSTQQQARLRQQQEDRALKGVTSMTYVPGRGEHVVASAGCATGVVKIWDLRRMSRPTETLAPSDGLASIDATFQSRAQLEEELTPSAISDAPQPTQSQRRKPFGDASSVLNMLSARYNGAGHAAQGLGDAAKAVDDKSRGRAKRVSKAKSKPPSTGGEEDPIEMAPIDESIDVTACGDGWNRSPHGLSSLVASSTALFAASTDGRIYQLPLASLAGDNSACLTRFGAASPLFHPSQRGNTLFSRLALHDDERTLALGCNSGDITLWDVKNAGVGNGVHGTSSSAQMPHVLRGAHLREINSLTWAHGPSGATLASISDDLCIRVWRPDRKAAKAAAQVYQGGGGRGSTLGSEDIF